jgi:LytS/YehU family sensor histidine kinase
LSADRKLEEGIGLSNTRARLKQLYGERQRFVLSDGPDGGLAVGVELPFHIRSDRVKGASGAERD